MTALTTASTTPALYRPASLDDAIERLATSDLDAVPIAGATWVMRSPARGEPFRGEYVSLARIEELGRIDDDGTNLTIGAAVTHARLAAALAGHPGLDVLRQAAAKSANPSVRRQATVGGNLCTTGFAAADLVPALLSLSAVAVVRGPAGETRMPLTRFLATRGAAPPATVLSHVSVPLAPVVSAHVRLTMRRAGDYPVVIVSATAAVDDAGVVESATVAVGSVEPVARLWPEMAAALVGRRLDADAAVLAAREHAGSFQARESVEVDGWYRAQVLPAVVGRAVRALERSGRAGREDRGEAGRA